MSSSLKGLYVNFTIFTGIMIQPSGFFFNSGRKWGHESKKKGAPAWSTNLDHTGAPYFGISDLYHVVYGQGRKRFVEVHYPIYCNQGSYDYEE